MLKKLERLTPAEDAILSAASQMEAGDARRREAAALLRDQGLPTRRVEAWHYTDLRNTLKSFAPPASRPEAAAIAAFIDADAAIAGAARVPFLDGVHLADNADSLPEGVRLTRGAAASGWRHRSDTIAQLNTMFAGDGVRVAVDPGVNVRQAIALVHGTSTAASMALRHSVELANGAEATFIEQHASADGIASLSNTVTGLTLEEGAKAQWVIVQQEGDAARHLAQLNVTLGKGAHLTILVLNAGGALVRREINVVVRGEGSQLVIRGVNLIAGQSHIDVTTSLIHEVPDTVSSEIFRNVVLDQGRGVFQGEIRVAQAAQKTDARMACNTLLLSDEAEFSAKPELEIFADDVQCAHGATVADIDPNHLFYLRARGIPEKLARSLLVRAFVEEVFEEPVEKAGMEALGDNLVERIENWLDRHG
ncbi:MAG: Fe-S cluster assembly protein SufD [Rhizobiaceae bacterium]